MRANRFFAGTVFALTFAISANVSVAQSPTQVPPSQVTPQPPAQSETRLTFPAVIIEVSLKDQTLSARAVNQTTGETERVILDKAEISSGKASRPTPTGTFTVLGKETLHESGITGGDMPCALRFTDDGNFIHAGTLPGYPASMGCIRLYRKDAETLFNAVPKPKDGVTRVIVRE